MFRVRAVSSGWQGAPGLSTFYFDESTEGSLDQAEQAADCAGRVQAAFGATTNLYPTLWRLDVAAVVDVLDPATGALQASIGISPPATVAGMEGAAFGAAAAGLCVNWLTDTIRPPAPGYSARRVRGRTFLVPMNNGGDTNGTPTEAHRGGAEGMFVQLQSPPTGSGLFGVWSRPQIGRVASPGVEARAGRDGVFSVATGVKVADQYAVLTSRR